MSKKRIYEKKRRVIIRPPERKFSKQMEISKGREEGEKEGGAVSGMKERGTHFCQFYSGFQMYYTR